MSLSTPAPGQYTTQLSGVNYGTVSGGIPPTNGQTGTLINQPLVSTVVVTVQPLPVKLPTLPVILGVTRGLFVNTDPSQLSDGFVGDPSSGTSLNCSEARVFTLGNGRLQSSGKLVSVDPGVKHIDIGNVPGGQIASGFESEDGFLVWRNAAFYNGVAGFCKAMNGHIYATFTDSGGPAGCNTVHLTVYYGKSRNSVLN
ncbi:hypothetical protein F5Y12DRAFT_557515 [Xylaria sp. FL1777]|nr:hypothetical protein F5Y12DRAFT_557515 [Xylaria sp. FL1777]